MMDREGVYTMVMVSTISIVEKMKNNDQGSDMKKNSDAMLGDLKVLVFLPQDLDVENCT